MDSTLGRALTRLPKGTLLPVPDPRRKGVAVFHGRAWVTQQDDPRDVLLGAGESFALDRPGVAIVQALDDTSLLIFEVAPGPARAPETAPRGSGRRAAGDIGSHELHQQARRQRSAAIAAAIAAAATATFAAASAAVAGLLRRLRPLGARR